MRNLVTEFGGPFLRPWNESQIYIYEVHSLVAKSIEIIYGFAKHWFVLSSKQTFIAFKQCELL